MYKVLSLNEISPVVNGYLTKDKYTVTKDEAAPEAVLVRSADMHAMELPASLLAVARAGAGVNNIPTDKCAEQGIVVFNTPGANANGVKELVIAAMLTMSRSIVDAVKWAADLTGEDVPKQVEKGKSQFVGPELKNKRLGVIGLGAIGAMVANDCHALGMEVSGYDPFISVEAAWSLSRSIRRCQSLDALFAESDYITVHVPLVEQTRSMFCAENLLKMKDGVRILNFSRGELVNNADMLSAIKSGKVAGYATDFPTAELLNVPGVLAIPHLGASTPESEDNCAVMAAKQLADYIEYGNIKNSVNYPSCELPYTGRFRITVLHRNIANMVGQITAVLAARGANISDMINKSKGGYAYTIIDLDDKADAKDLEAIGRIEGVMRVRAIG